MFPTPVQLTFAELIRALVLNPAADTERWRARRPRAARQVPGDREALHRRLRRYEEELERLRVENEYLRQSAMAFGDLAERLNHSIRSAHPLRSARARETRVEAQAGNDRGDRRKTLAGCVRVNPTIRCD